jgi:glycosyltransferase involved in cell wall biosynthesis
MDSNLKRIAILVLSRHISSLGGIGFYVDSFIAASKGRYICDIITDRPIKKSDIPFTHIKECDIIFSNETLSYGNSSEFFMFYGEKSFFELGINIIASIKEAYKTRIYDCLFINSHEIGTYMAHVGFKDFVPTVAYTHHNIFYRGYPDSIDECGAINLGLVEVPHITQAPGKKFNFLKELHHVPMVTSEYDLFVKTQPKPEKNTVFYNGTFRDIKRPKDFLDLCIKFKKKGLIITNKKGKEFFEKEFAKAGLECEIRTSIFGQEKVDFISRGEVMFHPAKNEMMSLAVLEGLFFMPVFVYQENWIDMCPPGMLTVLDNIDHFEFRQPEVMDRRAWVTSYFEPEKNMEMFEDVLKVLDRLNPNTSSSTLKDVQKEIEAEGGLAVSAYWGKIKGRSSINLADLVTFYKISKNAKVSHTAHESFFGDPIQSGMDSMFN